MKVWEGFRLAIFAYLVSDKNRTFFTGEAGTAAWYCVWTCLCNVQGGGEYGGWGGEPHM